MNSVRLGVVVVGVLAFLAAAHPAYPYTFSADRLSVTVEGSNPFNFTDDFNDGSPPPSAPGFAPGYFVTGVVGPESEGKLTLDSSDAIASRTANGFDVLFQGALLRTNIDGNEPGLYSDRSFSVMALFDLIEPSAGESYGVRFTDRNLGLSPPRPGNDLPELQVTRSLGGDLFVRFLEANFIDGTVTPIASVALDTNHDQIELALERLDPTSNAITASFRYWDGDVAGAFTPLADTVDIFEGENWTRVQVVARALAPIPEPATVLLLGAGLAGLAALTRTRRDRWAR